ncbi:MAG TPA: lipid-A-disaccharide synthase, partial [Thermoanaerobaculia bacterium]|nr:lipid-A-disaccharide synthase [Thermoanaerobaculia bacterium]
MNLLLSAGEASGDLHGSRLLAALRQRRPDLHAFGMGGARLVEAGLEPIVRREALSVVGITEVLEKLPAVRRALRALDAAAAARRPDAAVLIDFPDFHALLARRLFRAGIPIVYYVSPQVWAWRRGRAQTIARRARRIVTLFAFETEIYRRLGADAKWAGHPLVEEVAEDLAMPSPLPEKRRRRLVLLPGSRAGEVARHWPVLAEAAVRLARRFDLDVFAVRAPGLPERLFDGAAPRGITVTETGLHPLLASADLAFVASGTATLDAALCGAPMVVVYRTSAVSHAIARALVKLRWIALVNIVAGEPVVPELIQGALTPEALERAGADLLSSPEKAEAMRRGLARAARALGPPGASERAAGLVLSAIGERA